METRPFPREGMLYVYLCFVRLSELLQVGIGVGSADISTGWL